MPRNQASGVNLDSFNVFLSHTPGESVEIGYFCFLLSICNTRTQALIAQCVAHSYSLLSLFSARPPFIFNSLRTLLPKHPGWGYLCDSSAPSAPERYHLFWFLSPLCFHALTNPFSRNSFRCTSIQNPGDVLPPIHLQRKEKMPQQTAKPTFINNSFRCTHRFANGMRSRLLTLEAGSVFCAHVNSVENQREPADTAAALTADLKEFRSAIPINDFLARLLLLLAENKISPRRAAVLAYITNQLLRTPPPSTANSIPKKIPISLLRSSGICPAPNATVYPHQSPRSPLCPHDHSGTAF